MAALAPEPEDHEISAPVPATAGDLLQADLIAAENAAPVAEGGSLAYQPSARQRTDAPEPAPSVDLIAGAGLAKEPADGPASPVESVAGDF